MLPFLLADRTATQYWLLASWRRLSGPSVRPSVRPSVTLRIVGPIQG